MRYFRNLLVVATMALLAQDVATQSHAASALIPPLTGHFALSVQVELISPLEVDKRSLMPSQVAHTGDRFALQIHVDQPAYVYLVDYSETSWSRLHFPASLRSPVLVQAGEHFRLPQHGSVYKLNGEPGEITLYVLASRRPLEAEQVALLRLPWPSAAQEVTRSGESPTRPSPPPPPPPPPRPGKSAREREGQLVSDFQNTAVQVKSDDQGVALLRFSFIQSP